MSMLSFEKYKISDTVDVAYFEPLSERFYGNHFKEESVVISFLIADISFR
jgi:hypothetical protein